MSKNKNKNKRAEAPGANKNRSNPERPILSHAEQSRQIHEVLDQASNRGMPSAEVIAGMFKLAEIAYNSGLFKAANSPAGCLVKMMFGYEIGLSPMLSMINIDIVDDVPAMSSQLMLAHFVKDGGEVEWMEHSDVAAKAIFHYDGKSMDFKFDINDVNRAKLGGKDNHSKYPRAMMGWRMISEAIKLMAPGCLLKAYTYGELTDDRAHDTESYRALAAMETKALEGPKESAARRRQQNTNTGDRGNVNSLKTKIGFINNQLESPAVPEELRVKTRKWIENNNITDVQATKVIAKLKPFEINDKGGYSAQASTKQVELLSKLTKSSCAPEATISYLNDAGDKLTKGEASAFIEQLNWFIEEKKKRPDPDPEDNPRHEEPAAPAVPANSSETAEEAPTELPLDAGKEILQSDETEFSKYLARKEALDVLAETKKFPLKKVAGYYKKWCEEGPDNEEKLAYWEDLVNGLPLKKEKK